MTLNHTPFHAVSIGDKSPQVVQTIIEIPSGSKAKYELDKESRDTPQSRQ